MARGPIAADGPSAARRFGRAFAVRCPRCGARGLFRSWFHMQERCPRCRLELERGETQDYWLGGMMFNIVLSETLAVLVVAVAVALTWPRVPWNGIWAGAIALMIVAPVVLFPVSRTLWLAFDLSFRPEHHGNYH